MTTSTRFRGQNNATNLKNGIQSIDSKKHKYIYTPSINTVFIAVFVSIFISICIYILSLSHVSNISDLIEVLYTASLPRVNNRCKVSKRHFKCLPNLYFIGASKAGTTALTDILAKLPHFHYLKRRLTPIDNHREVHRFDRSSYGFSWKYLELMYEWAACPESKTMEDVIIHYTPHYLFAPSVPFDLKDFHPDYQNIKFLIILREPIARAWSSYWFHNSHLFNEFDKGSVEEFYSGINIEIEERKAYNSCLAGCPNAATFNSSVLMEPMLEPKRQLFLRCLKRCFRGSFRGRSLGHRHIDKGIYFDQLIRWFANFPKHNFFIMSYDAWKENPKIQVLLLLRFLELPPKLMEECVKAIDFVDFNSTRLVKPNVLSWNQSIPLYMLKEITEFIGPHNARLKSLTGIDFQKY